MVNVAHPPRQSLGPSQAIAPSSDPAGDDYDELLSSNDGHEQDNDDDEHPDGHEDIASAAANIKQSTLSPAKRASQGSPPHQTVQRARPSTEMGPSEPEAGPSGGARGATDRSSRSPTPVQPKVLDGLRVVPSGKFNPADLAEVESIVLSLGGEWPQPIVIDGTTSLVVLGRDLKPKAEAKIHRYGTATAYGLDGFKAWIREREQADIHPEPILEEVEVEVEVAADEVPADVAPVYEVPADAPGQEVVEELVEEPASQSLFQDKEGNALSFWIEGKIPSGIRTDLDQLIKDHGGVLAPIDDADFRLLDPTTPFGKANLAEDFKDRGVNRLAWRGRPWHWVHVSVGQDKLATRKSLESEQPVFVRQRVEGGAQLVCYIAKALDRERPYLAKRIRSYGGTITSEKAAAKVLIVDEDVVGNKSTQTIKNNYGSDVKKFIVSYQWVEKSIKKGRPATLSRPGGLKNEFLRHEDELLPRYLAEVIVGQENGTDRSASTQKMKRHGNKIYEYLCDDAHVERWPWSSRHPWQAWRERYRKFKELMDPKIEEFCRQLRRNGKFAGPHPMVPIGGDDGDDMPGPVARNSNKRARSPDSLDGSASPRAQQLPPARQSVQPSPKRARVALAPRERSASHAAEDVPAVEEQAEEDDYVYPADDDNVAQADDPIEDQPVQADDEMPAEEPAPAESAVVPSSEPDYDAEDRRALEESLRIPLKSPSASKRASKAVEAEPAQVDEDEAAEEVDDDPSKWLAQTAVVAVDVEEKIVEEESYGEEGDSDSDHDDDPTRWLAKEAAPTVEDQDDEDMYDVSGVSGGLELAADEDDQEMMAPVEEIPQEAEVEPAAEVVPSRATRSRSAVSAELTFPPNTAPKATEHLPHLDIIPSRRTSSGSRRISSADSSPERVAPAPRSFVAGALASVASAASQALGAISSPRKTLQVPSSTVPTSPVASSKRSSASSSSVSPRPEPAAVPARSPAPTAAPPSPPRVNIHPPPRPAASASKPAPPPPAPRVPSPVLTPAETKRNQEAAVAWAMLASPQFGIPVIAAIQTLRAVGGNIKLAEERLRAVKEGVHHVWTEEEDEIVRGGTKEETSRLQAKVGPMEFVKRLTELRA